MADEGNAIIWGIFCLGAGIFLFYMGFKWKKQKRLIEDTPTSKVRSLAMGRVEVFGAVQKARKIFQSPFSGTNCVWCKWMVEEYRRQGKHSRWVTIASGLLSDYFYLKDDTGSVSGDISSRRGRMLGMEVKGKRQIIKALVPLSEMFSYANELKSMTAGRGTFTMSISGYEQMPSPLAAKIIESRKKHVEEE